jgi:hypothetical protein
MNYNLYFFKDFPVKTNALEQLIQSDETDSFSVFYFDKEERETLTQIIQDKVRPTDQADFIYHAEFLELNFDTWKKEHRQENRQTIEETKNALLRKGFMMYDPQLDSIYHKVKNVRTHTSQKRYDTMTEEEVEGPSPLIIPLTLIPLLLLIYLKIKRRN